MEQMIAYILTGGEGIRVKEVTDKYNCMKHEIPINGRPFIQHMKDWLDNQMIIDGYMELSKPYVGTAGAIKDMHADGEAPFLLVYGDCFSPINVDELYHQFINCCIGMEPPDMLIVTRTVNVPDYGWIAATEHGKVLKYQRHHDYSYYNTNIGTYMIGRAAYEYIKEQPWQDHNGQARTLSLEYDIFNQISKVLNIYTYDCTALPYYDVGTSERIQITEGLLHASN